jgi:hypothetical protein
MVELNLFRHFIPTHCLPPDERAELARHSHVTRFEAGVTPFRRNSASTAAYVWSAARSSWSTKAAPAASRPAPRRRAIRCATRSASMPPPPIQASTLLFIDRAKLDFVLPWTQTGTIEVSEIAGDDQDWGMMISPATTAY